MDVKLKLLIAAGFFLFAISLVGIGQAVEKDEYLVKAQEVVEEFGASLKGELKVALAEGGAGKAIRVCSEKAAVIANNISRKTGWAVRRVSLKQRNPLNRSDEYEHSVLRQFERQAAGKENLEQYDTVIIQGVKEFRYMKAIKIKPLCLKCHGMADNITAEVKTELESRYPHDRATGYSVGQIRGAFSVRIPLE